MIGRSLGSARGQLRRLAAPGREAGAGHAVRQHGRRRAGALPVAAGALAGAGPLRLRRVTCAIPGPVAGGPRGPRRGRAAGEHRPLDRVAAAAAAGARPAAAPTITDPSPPTARTRDALSAFVPRPSRPRRHDQPRRMPEVRQAGAARPHRKRRRPPSTAASKGRCLTFSLHPLQRRARRAARSAREAAPQRGSRTRDLIRSAMRARRHPAGAAAASADGARTTLHARRHRQRAQRAARAVAGSGRRCGACGSSFSSATQSWRLKLHARTRCPGGSRPACPSRAAGPRAAPLRLSVQHAHGHALQHVAADQVEPAVAARVGGDDDVAMHRQPVAVAGSRKVAQSRVADRRVGPRVKHSRSPAAGARRPDRRSGTARLRVAGSASRTKSKWLADARNPARPRAHHVGHERRRPRRVDQEGAARGGSGPHVGSHVLHSAAPG